MRSDATPLATTADPATDLSPAGNLGALAVKVLLAILGLSIGGFVGLVVSAFAGFIHIVC
jgi:hypothetical protein